MIFAAAILLLCVGLWTLVLLGYFPGKIDFEEQAYGALARDLLEGGAASLVNYKPQPWESGAIPYGLWVFPFFAVFGSSLFSLKLAAAVFAAVSMVAWVDLARLSGGNRTAWAFAALVVLPCPFVLRMTLTGFSPATHLACFLFSGVALNALWRAQFASGTLRRVGLFAGGMSLGVGSLWVFSFWPLAIGGVLTALLQLKRRRELGWLILGMIPGSAGVLALLASEETDAQGTVLLDVLRFDFSSLITNQGKSDTGVLAHGWDLLVTYFPLMSGFTSESIDAFVLFPSVLHYVLVVALSLVFGASCLRRLVDTEGQTKARNVLPVFAAVVVFAVVYLMSGLYAVELPGYDRFRYFLPVYPFALLMMAHAACSLKDAETPPVARHGYRAVVAVVVVLGAASVGNVMELNWFPTPYLYFRGYDQRPRILNDHQPQFAWHALSLDNRFDRDELAWSLGINEAYEAMPHLPRQLRPYFFEGLGARRRLRNDDEMQTGSAGVAGQHGSSRATAGLRDDLLHELLAEVSGRRSIEDRMGFLRGYLKGVMHLGPQSELSNEEIVQQLKDRIASPRLKSHILRELHMVMGESMVHQSLFTGSDPLVSVLPAEMGAEEQDEFISGFARGMSRKLNPGVTLPRNIQLPVLEGLSPRHRTVFFKTLKSQQMLMHRLAILQWLPVEELQ